MLRSPDDIARIVLGILSPELRDNLGEYMSLEHCRVSIERVCPRKGDVMVTNRRRPILKIMEDTAPGTHDTLLAACDRYRYELLGCKEYHRNCTDTTEKPETRRTSSAVQPLAKHAGRCRWCHQTLSARHQKGRLHRHACRNGPGDLLFRLPAGHHVDLW